MMADDTKITMSFNRTRPDRAGIKKRALSLIFFFKKERKKATFRQKDVPLNSHNHGTVLRVLR